jgi:Xaa-Pro aminopeptidase
MQGQVSAGKATNRIYENIIGEMATSHREHVPDYGIGYGIGLAPQEAPWITAEDGDQIEKGMCLALRLVARDENLGAVLIGDTFSVTDKGLECLTR